MNVKKLEKLDIDELVELAYESDLGDEYLEIRKKYEKASGVISRLYIEEFYNEVFDLLKRNLGSINLKLGEK
jgi:hypothetical protein